MPRVSRRTGVNPINPDKASSPASEASSAPPAVPPRGWTPKRSKAAPPHARQPPLPTKASTVQAPSAGRPSPQVAALQQAFEAGDLNAVRRQLQGASAASNAALMARYRAETGRDLEYDMRGFPPSVDFNPLDGNGLRLRGGLKGPALQEGFALLHGPRVAATAARLAELAGSQPLSEAANGELYRLLGQAGGEERALLAKEFHARTGKDLEQTLRPMVAAAVKANDLRPIESPPEKTVAVVVSSGNWKAMLEGKTDEPIGGYHWREIEAYVKEALDNGYTPVFFTPDGLPPSPDALSLLQGKLGPKLGFGLREGTGPDSRQGQAIIDGLMHPRSMASFDQAKFATLHIAGGHGSHHDLIGHAGLERAGLALNGAGKVVTAVCHATPALGKLLEGGKATGFSPQFDQVMSKAGYVLPEFQPPYDAHAGLRKLGARVSTLAALNINHTETQHKNGAPVVTGTGPEATDNVAKAAFKWLAENRPADSVPRFREGPSAGKPVDIDRKRSARQLPPAEAARYHPKPGELVLDGFHHQGKFYTAVVPANAIERVDFHTEQYPDALPLVDVGAHNQLRFRFGSEVRLYENGPAAQPSATLRELMYSVEGLNAVGEKPFDAASVGALAAGTKQAFVTAYRMTSVEQRKSEMYNVKDGQPHTVDQVSLSLGRAQSEQVLRALLADASAAGVERPFHSVKRNCLTELLRVVDGVTGFDQGLVPDGSLPHLGERELKKRGLIAHDDGRLALSAW